MDLKERKRLREQMDMLNIKRDENIARKRAAAKERFLKRVFFLKEDHERRMKEQEEILAAEKAHRYVLKEELERQEEEKLRLKAEQARHRQKRIHAKESRTEEQEEEELMTMRARWKARDAEKAKIIKEAHEKTMKERAEAAAQEEEEQKNLADTQVKREAVWLSRDKRVKAKADALIHRALEVKNERQRHALLIRERNLEYLKDLHKERQPIFEQQLERTEQRRRDREAEEE